MLVALCLVGFFCFIVLVLCPIVLFCFSDVLCYVWVKGDWMERLLYSVLNCRVLRKSMGSINNKRGGFILYTLR